MHPLVAVVSHIIHEGGFDLRIWMLFTCITGILACYKIDYGSGITWGEVFTPVFLHDMVALVAAIIHFLDPTDQDFRSRSRVTMKTKKWFRHLKFYFTIVVLLKCLGDGLACAYLSGSVDTSYVVVIMPWFVLLLTCAAKSMWANSIEECL